MKAGELKGVLASQFGISEVESINPISGGDWNHVYKAVCSGESWIVRRSHRRKSVEHAQFELGLLARLCDVLSYVPRPRRTVLGELLWTDSEDIVAVMEFKDGEALSPRSTGIAGTTLRQVHDALNGLTPQPSQVNDMSIVQLRLEENYFYKSDVLADLKDASCSSGSAQSHLAELCSMQGSLMSIREALSGKLRGWQTGVRFLPRVIHGDYYSRNILSLRGQVSGLIDWDETVSSWQEYELACAAWEFSRDDPSHRMDEGRFHTFLDAYYAKEARRPIDDGTVMDLIAIRRIIEIQLSLFEFFSGDSSDLDYCVRSARFLMDLERQ